MAEFKVVFDEMRSAATNVAKANEAFREAAQKLQTASNNLTEVWEGSAREKFVSAMDQRRAWYDQMAQIVDNYVAELNQIADAYNETDQRGASIIRNGR